MMLRVLLFLAISLVILSGCSGEPAQEVTSETDTPSIEEELAEEVIPEEAIEEEIEVVIIEAHATVESASRAYSDSESIDWTSIVTQQARVFTYSDYSLSTILIANFETTEYLKTVDLEPGQAVICITLKQPALSIPVAGVYDLTICDGEFTGSASVRIAGGVTVLIATSNIVVGEVEITGVTADAVTGAFDVQDSWTTVTGEFQAPIIQIFP